MFRYFLTTCLVLLSAGLCLGQQTPPDNIDFARQRAQAVADQLPTLIKDIDEPTLRIALRLRTAAFLWASGFEATSELAGDMTLAALEDLKNHESQLPAARAKRMYLDIISLLRLRAPALLQTAKEKYGLAQLIDQNRLLLASTELSAGQQSSVTVESVRRSLNRREDLDSSIPYFMDRLEREQPAEFIRLLPEILAAVEQRANSISLETLSMLTRFYLRNEQTPELKRRFLQAVVRATGRSSILSDPQESIDAFDLLSVTLPLIEKLLPSVYAQAGAQLAAISTRVSQQRFDLAALNERIKRSPDPLEELIREAERSENRAFRDDLLVRAARLAIHKGQLKLAVDLFEKTAIAKAQGSWPDQFLDEIVTAAIAAKDAGAAEYASARISAATARARALQRIALYLASKGDAERAAEIIKDAINLIETMENSTDKAGAMLEAATTFLKIDKARAAEIIRRAVKIGRDAARPKPEDRAAREDYVNGVTDFLGQFIEVFRSLAQTDEFLALSLADEIQNREFKASALLGVSMGIIVGSKNKSAPSSPQRAR